MLLEDYNGQKELYAEDENGCVSIIEHECYRHLDKKSYVASNTKDK